MSRLKRLKNQVEQILTECPVARGDDRFLVTAMYVKFYGVDPNASFKSVMKDYTLPPFESIRRTRQKVQEENEDLRADKFVEDLRLKLQEEYIEFAKEGA